ncbi:MAG: hypothetical protein ABR878_14285 [Roseiarcus sp.]|jgi:hypothetical protein
MGYSIPFRRTPLHPVEYDYEKEPHRARDAAHAILLQNFELFEIECTSSAYPLNRSECLAAHEARARYREKSGVNLYAGEDAYVLTRFRDAHPN